METLEELYYKLEAAHRKREDLMKMRISAENGINALIKRLKKSGESTGSLQSILMESFSDIIEEEKAQEKIMVNIAKQLPLVNWFIQFRGCAYSGYAQLIAEIGDLRNYDNPAKIWKRMGLSVNDGKADKNHTKGVNTGYSRRRRMICHRITTPIIQNRGFYRQYYDTRKQFEIERDSTGYNENYITDNKQNMLRQFKSPANRKLINSGRMPNAVLDLRAQRYMMKRLLKDLWIQWSEYTGPYLSIRKVAIKA